MPNAPIRSTWLLVIVLVIATSGLVYELLAGTVASYVLGDSVTQFSTTIGVYLFAMGLGSYLSRFIRRDISARFVDVELAIAITGGMSAPLLFMAFARTDVFSLLLYALITVIGTLVGLEIPLLMRILKEVLDFEELIAKVLSVDYLGALAGSLLFALVLVPRLGLNRTGLLFGLLNTAVAMVATWVLSKQLSRATRIRLRVQGFFVASALMAMMWKADTLTSLAEQDLYANPIVYAQQSRYQRIVITRGRRSVQLFLNGNLQFSSTDEYRYHEALVHPAFASTPKAHSVLVLGGGDGLAVREILRYPTVTAVTLVDLDPMVTDLAKRSPHLRNLNDDALSDPRVTVLNDDAMVWLDERRQGDAAPYDVVVIDFPDPTSFSLGKLYTRRFFRLVSAAMHADATAVIQSASPLYARQSFWCVDRTLEAAGFATQPFHVTVPSFGEWGFVLARKSAFDPPQRLAIRGLDFLTDETLNGLFRFPADMDEVEVEENRLDNQRLVHYYLADQAAWTP